MTSFFSRYWLERKEPDNAFQPIEQTAFARCPRKTHAGLLGGRAGSSAGMLANLWLVTRNVATIILIPGTVTVYIPYLILGRVDVPSPGSWSWHQYAAAFVLSAGVAILLRSIWSFARVGRGTLAPFDETRKLIVVGLYRYVRNPMYVAVMMILLAESWFFGSSRLLIYAGIFFVAVNLMVIGYEENRLRYKYGDEYRRYCAHVGRWIPGRAYEDAD